MSSGFPFPFAVAPRAERGLIAGFPCAFGEEVPGCCEASAEGAAGLSPALWEDARSRVHVRVGRESVLARRRRRGCCGWIDYRTLGLILRVQYRAG